LVGVDVEDTAGAGQGVVVEDRVGESGVSFEAQVSGFDRVVIALGERKPVVITKASLPGWEGEQVVDGAAGGAGPTGAETLDQDLGGNVHMDEERRRKTQSFEEMAEVGGLFDRAGIAVNQEAVAAIFGSEAGFEEGIDQSVGHELAGGKELVNPLAGGGMKRGFVAQHIASGNRGDSQFVPQQGGLCSFAATRRPEQEQNHDRLPDSRKKSRTLSA